MSDPNKMTEILSHRPSEFYQADAVANLTTYILQAQPEIQSDYFVQDSDGKKVKGDLGHEQDIFLWRAVRSMKSANLDVYDIFCESFQRAMDALDVDEITIPKKLEKLHGEYLNKVWEGSLQPWGAKTAAQNS